jgi:hypothetical protein
MLAADSVEANYYLQYKKLKLTATINTTLIKEHPLIMSGQGSGPHFLVAQFLPV